MISRDSSGKISNVTDGPVNLNRTEVSGVDAVVRYRLNTDLGRWDLNLSVSKLNSLLESSTLNDGSQVQLEKAGTAGVRESYPEWRGNLSAQWQQQDWSAAYTLRYIGDSTEVFANEPRHIGSVVYHGVSAGYNLTEALALRAGVNNLFDKQPPVSLLNVNINFDQQTYNAVGRFYYLQLSYEF